jgi:transposase
MQEQLVGVDVSKDTLDICLWPTQTPSRIGNRRAEIKRWLKSLPTGTRIAMESTGAFHQLLAELAAQTGMHPYVLNPKRVWHAARGDGRRGKTDRIDAQVIAKFLVDHLDSLHEWRPGSSIQREIGELQRRRHCLERHATALRMSLKSMRGLDKEVAAIEDGLRQAMQAIDLRIDLLGELDQTIARKSVLLQTVPAIGRVGAMSLATLFERIPFECDDAVVAFVGLDVRACDSGARRGRRHLTKLGPAYLRKQIWLMGFAGAHTKLYKPIYEALLARGFKFTEAATILGRRILRIAWSIWRTDRPFDAARFAARG